MGAAGESDTQEGHSVARRDFLVNASKVVGATAAMGMFGGLLEACGLTSSPSAPSVQSNKPLNMGWVLPTTGLLSNSYAPLFANGLLAIKEINAAGGILGQPIQRTEVDDGASAANEPLAVKQLQSSSIEFLCGPAGSSQSLASLAATTPARMIQATYAIDTPLGDGKKYPYHYQLTFNTDQEAEACVSYLVKKLGITKLGFLQEDTAFGQGATAASMNVLDKLKVSRGPVVTYPINATDLTSQVSKLKDAGVVGIVAWVANIPNAIQVFNALHSLGWTPPITGHSGLLFTPDRLVKAASASVLDKVYAIHYRSLSWSGSSSPGSRQTEYVKNLNAVADMTSTGAISATAPFYDFLYLLKHVVESEKSFDPAKIKRALDDVRGYGGMLGTINLSSTKHTGYDVDAVAMVKVSSGTDPRAMNCFRELAPGQ